jgi:hypothetical protein
MPCPEDEAWFPSRTSDSNWGHPKRWQGWAVLTAYFVLLVIGAFLLPTGSPVYWIVYGGSLSLCTGIIVWLKKESR